MHATFSSLGAKPFEGDSVIMSQAMFSLPLSPNASEMVLVSAVAATKRGNLSLSLSVPSLHL